MLALPAQSSPLKLNLTEELQRVTVLGIKLKNAIALLLGKMINPGPIICLRQERMRQEVPLVLLNGQEQRMKSGFRLIALKIRLSQFKTLLAGGVGRDPGIRIEKAQPDDQD
jgi:hypothetical protein